MVALRPCDCGPASGCPGPGDALAWIDAMLNDALPVPPMHTLAAEWVVWGMTEAGEHLYGWPQKGDRGTPSAETVLREARDQIAKVGGIPR